MAEFEKALKKVLLWEGGKVDDPNDLGGRTAYGITQRTYNQYFKGDVWDITEEQIRYIYRIGYWDKIQGDLIISQSVAELTFDFAVNSGPSMATKKLQMLLNLTPDGRFGPLTLRAVNKKHSGVLFRELYDVRVAYYKLIVKNRPSNSKYLQGWLNRLSSYKYEN